MRELMDINDSISAATEVLRTASERGRHNRVEEGDNWTLGMAFK